MATVGTLNVDLIANTARFISDMAKSSKVVRTFADTAKRAFKSFGSALKSAVSSVFSLKGALAGLISGGAIVALTAATLSNIDAIGKMSQTYGIATKDIATFQLAAELGGSSLETFAKAARQISKNVFDFVKRGTGEASDAFKELGITTQTLQPIMNDQVALIGLVGERLNNLEDGAIKTALAYKLFGGRAIELLPALAGGAKTLAKTAAEARQLGLAMSQQAVKGVERANDAITRLKFLFTGFTQQTVAALAPALESGVTAFKNFILEQAKAAGGIENFAKTSAIRVLQAFKSLVQGAATVVEVLGKVKNGLIAIGLIDNTKQEQAIAGLSAKIAIYNEHLQNYAKRNLQYDQVARDIIIERAKAQEELNRLQGNDINLIAGITAGLDSLIKKAKEIKITPPEVPTNPATAAAGNQPQPVSIPEQPITQPFGPSETLQTDYIEKFQAQMAQHQEIYNRAILSEREYLVQTLASNIDRTQEALNAGAISEQQAAADRIALTTVTEQKLTAISNAEAKNRKQARIETEKASTAAMVAGANNISSIFGSLGALVGNSSKRTFALQKNLQRGSVIMSTAAGIMRAFSDAGPFGGPVAAAAIALKGAAQLALINRTQYSGGGSTPSGAVNIPSVGATAPNVANIANNETNEEKTVTYVFNYYGPGDLSYARDTVAPEIRRMITDDDYQLTPSTSRNGQTLRGEA